MIGSVVINRFACVAFLILVACGTAEHPSSEARAESRSTPSTRVSIGDALQTARLAMASTPDYKLAFVSNTGVTQSVRAQELSGPADALMDKSGRAGQWVFEFYRDTPTPATNGGKRGFRYPFQIVLVSGARASQLPDSTMGVPKALAELSAARVKSVAALFARAAGKQKIHFDVASVASFINSDGDCTWTFRFYDLKSGEIAAKELVPCG